MSDRKLVIIPAYNESKSIIKAVEDIKEHAPGFDYVVINDCSTDDTLKVCQERGLNYVHLPVNLGIGGAVQTGYLYGCQYGYDLAVQFDGDGQHDAAYLEMMAKTLKERQHSLSVRQEEYQRLHESLLLSNTARIKVHGTIYAGVWVGVAEVGMNLKSKYNHSQLFKEKGEIVVRPL